MKKSKRWPLIVLRRPDGDSDAFYSSVIPRVGDLVRFSHLYEVKSVECRYGCNDAWGAEDKYIVELKL